MPSATKTRTTWAWVVVALIVVVAIAVVATLTVTNGGSKTEPTQNPGSSSVPTPSATQGESDATPTGCLGGEARDSAMLVTAVEEADHTSNGAVEVGASFVRWIQRFPYPTADEAAVVSDNALADDSFTDDLTQYLEDRPDLSGGIVPSGETYWMSTVPGVWHLESTSADRVVVTIGSAFVVDGALSPTLRSSISITLVWENGSWRVADAEGSRTTEELYSVGKPFASGC
jgi:hypothetical protein